MKSRYVFIEKNTRMGHSKKESIRYRILDQCLANQGRQWDIRLLLEKVNAELIESGLQPISSRTTFYKDIEQLELIYKAPIEKYKINGKVFFRYEEKDFSIFKTILSDEQSVQLKATINLIQKFKGKPQYEFIEEMIPILKDKFGIDDNQKQIIFLDENTEYYGKKYISDLFEKIANNQVLEVTYQPFDREPINFIFHPQILKEFNNRWFVIGFNESMDIESWIIPLDRIVSIESVKVDYITINIDWEDYFDDFIGITKNDTDMVTVELKVDSSLIKYLRTKPIHHSQKVYDFEDYSMIQINVIPNYELESIILSHGEKIEVVSPDFFRKIIKKRVNSVIIRYQ